MSLENIYSLQYILAVTSKFSIALLHQMYCRGNYDNIKDEEENEKNYGAVYFNPDALKDYELPVRDVIIPLFTLILLNSDNYQHSIYNNTIFLVL